MTGVLSVLAAILLIALMVVMHELGHFCAGRVLGFGIDEFSIGFGPALLKKEKNGTVYALRLIPLGGACMFHGEDEEAEDERSFMAQSVWKRAIVIAAGPLVNILSAVLIAVIILMSYGEYMPRVYEFDDTVSIAQEAGVEIGDIIYGVNGKRLDYANEVVDRITSSDGESLTLNIIRDGERMDITMHDVYNEEDGYTRIGIIMNFDRMKYGLFEAVGRSFNYVWQMIKEIAAFLGSLFQGNVSSGDVSGVVGAVSVVSEAVKISFETVLRIVMLLSMNLGLMNLLPIPALDGGRLVFIIIEAVRGKPAKQSVEGVIHFVGLILLLALMVIVTVSDVRTLIFGG